MKYKRFIILVFTFVILISGCQNQHKHSFVDYQCSCGEKENIIVKFMNGDNTKEVIVKYGECIDIENNEFININDDLFIGWFNESNLFSFI